MDTDFSKEKKILLKFINTLYSGITINTFEVFPLYEEDFNSFNGWEKSTNIAVYADISRAEPFNRDEQRDISKMTEDFLPYKVSITFNGVY